MTLNRSWIQLLSSSSQLGLSPQEIGEVFDFCNNLGEYESFSLDDFSIKLNFTIFKSTEILRAMDNLRICRFESQCPACLSKLDIQSFSDLTEVCKCSNCKTELPINRISGFKIIPPLDKNKKEINQKIINQTYELNASLISSYCIKKEKVFYLISDVVNSQGKQNTDEILYAHQIEILWSKVWLKILQNINRPVLPVMAKGDCCVILFSEIEDLLIHLEELNKLVVENLPNWSLYLHISVIPFDINSIKLLIRGIDNKWDFNSKIATYYHRVSSQFKSANWKEKQSTLYITIYDDAIQEAENLFSDLNLDFSEEPYKVFIEKKQDTFHGLSISSIL